MKTSRLSLYMVLLCLAACGGGGGGSGESNNNNNNNGNDENNFQLPEDTANPLQYQGSTEAVILDAANVTRFAYGTLADSQSMLALPGSAYFISIPIISSNRGISSADGHGGKSAMTYDTALPIAAQTSGTAFCQQGTIDYYADIKEDGTGTAVYDNKSCINSGVTTDGMWTLKVLEYSFSPSSITHAILSFNRLIIGSNGVSMAYSGSIEIEEFPEINRDRLTLNIVAEEMGSGRKIRLADLAFSREYQDAIGSSTYRESVFGRVYDSAYGYVSIATASPVEYDFRFFGIPVGGELMLAGDAGSRALIELLGRSNVVLRLDSDADGVYEKAASLNLDRPVSTGNADIGDDDGDGMHNSWEIFYGLDPQDPADADLDLDGDSQNNRGEYRRGTAPDNAGSMSPTSDLGLHLDSFFENGPYPAGRLATITIGVRNEGPDEVDFTFARVTMPPEFVLGSVTAGEAVEECTTEDNVVSCKFLRLRGFIQISFVAPETVGDYDYEAVIFSSSSYDPDESDDVLNGVIEVKPATAELAVTLQDASDPVTTIDGLAFLLEIENTGALPALDVKAELELPVGASFSGTFPDMDCDASGVVVSCPFGNLGVGDSFEITFSIRPPSSPGPITTSVTVTSDTPEINTADNTAEQTTQVITPISDVSFNLSEFPSGPVGGELELSIAPAAAGPHYLPELEVTIDLPPEIDFVSYDAGFGSSQCSGGDPVVCTIPIFAGTSYESPSLILSSSTLGIHEFPATITSTVDDPDTSDNTIIVSAFVGQSVDSIQAQIDAAAPDDTIEVPAGYYWGDLEYSKNINLIGVDGAQNTFWSPEFSGIYVTGATSGTIAGFTFTHGISAPIVLDNSDINVRNNIFENIVSHTSTLATGLIVFGNSSAVVERNVLRNTVCNFLFPYVIRFSAVTDTVIRNNIFLNNGNCAGIDARGAVIVNNSFIGNREGLIMGVQSHISNNIFSGNEIGIDTQLDCGDDCQGIQSNLFYDNGQDFDHMTDPGDNNFADPLFTDATNGDFSLQSGSPAIDAGNALHAPADDIEGNPRPVDGDANGSAEYDIGAFEFQ